MKPARRLARRMGVRIEERARGGIAPYRIVVAELERQRGSIVLYRDALELLSQLVRARRLPFDPEMLEEIAIAHECVHYRLPRAAERDVHERTRRLLRLHDSPALLNDALTRHARGLAQ